MIKGAIQMSEFNFIVSYLDANGTKHDQEISLDSQDYKKHYIEETIAQKLGPNTPVEYDIAEMINTLDRDVKGVL